MKVDAHLLEIAQTLVIFGHAGRPIGILPLIERPGVWRGEVHERNRCKVEVRLYKFCRFRNGHVRMNVDG